MDLRHFRSLRRLAQTVVWFRKDKRGNVALLFGLCAVMIFTAMGAGLDLSRAYLARQKLSEVATLACQYASRPSVVDTSTASYNGSNGGSTYVTQVDNFINTTWQSQNVLLTQTNGTPFTYTQGGAATVSLSSTVPTTFMQIAGFTTIPIAVQTNCYATVATVQQRVPDSNSQIMMQETFAAGGQPGTWKTYLPNGTNGTQANPTTYTSATGYTGATGVQWHIMGYCMEQDAAGVIRPSTFGSNYSVELDCDNGSGTAGNSSISTLIYLPAGTYEIRYYYASRVDYPAYDPTYLCGSSASDLSWANNTATGWGSAALRTNQINVYLDLNNSSTDAPPTHVTMDGQVTLAGSNLIDMCVYGQNWLERSILITVTTPGYYWLSFAADGANDSFGGSIDDILLCSVSCTGSVQDNFPSSWTSATNLFEDTFESPVYSQDPYTSSAHAKGGNLAQSYGTTGSSSSGWPSQSSSGWAVAPYNQVVYWMQGASQGNQYISLQGWNGFSNSSDPLNRSISRSFLLDPGYYAISYKYTSLMDFSYDFIYGTNCSNNPTTANNYSVYGIKHGHDYGDTSTVYAQYESTNIVDVFFSNGQLISTPNINSTLGGAPTYTNPDGSVTSSPSVPPDNSTNFAAYSATAVNPVIDSCTYSSGYAWVSRTANVMIEKPGYYWLTLSAQGDPLTGVGAGAGIDDVKITAISSLYGSAPSSPATIPVASPQPGSNIYYNGFSISADRLTP